MELLFGLSHVFFARLLFPLAKWPMAWRYGVRLQYSYGWMIRRLALDRTSSVSQDVRGPIYSCLDFMAVIAAVFYFDVCCI